MRFTPRAEFPRQRPLLASPLVLLSGEELIITEFPRQRPLLASPLVLLSGEQLGCCGRGRYLLPTPGVIFDACGWAWTFSSTPRATRSALSSTYKLYEFNGLNYSVDDDTTKYCRTISARRRRRQHGRRRRRPRNACPRGGHDSGRPVRCPSSATCRRSGGGHDGDA